MPRKSKSQPFFLNRVLKAIADLKENHGSTARKIVNQFITTLRTSSRLKSKSKSQNLVLHIRRALTYGVENGLLKLRAGRYKIDSEKSFSRKANKSFDDEDYSTSRRGENPGPHLRSRKRTSQSSTATTTASSRSSYTTDASSTPSTSRSRTPHRRHKRKSSRQKRGMREKSKNKKGRRHCSNTNNDPEPHSRDSRDRTSPEPQPEPQPEPEPVPEYNPSELESRPSGSSSRHRKRRSRHSVEDENNDVNMTSVNCDNEDCLCNLKQQHSSHHGGEEGPSDDYIN